MQLMADSGQLDSNDSLRCDKGLVVTDVLPCLKEHLDKPQADAAAEKKYVSFKAATER